ncbi:hypothetical protein WA026_009784 [Henosepilachna vigintioctopunctata]|uniref:Ion transport domain-containing protein n=1 Tax=Henosepilachna vigintioctopunctata TaxID=420089 RepID=A0AAW1TJ04_9CUCU
MKTSQECQSSEFVRQERTKMPNTSTHVSEHRVHLENSDSLNYYLDNGGDITERDEKGNTLLHVTIFYNKDDESKNGPLIEILLRRGADVNAKNMFCETPLYLAIWHSNDVALSLLLAAGAELVFKSENALHLAAEVGYVRNVELLLASPRCDKELINALDYDGYTPAYRAALTGHKFSLKNLALAGADLSFKGRDHTIMEVIFDEITRPEDWIVDLLDEGVTCEVGAQKHSYVVDLSILAPCTNERQLEILVDIIGAANLQEENVVLQHPLIEFLLILKWSKLCYFYYYVLVTYTVFALSLSFYGFSINKLLGGCKVCDVDEFYYRIEFYRWIATLSGFLIFCHVGLQCIMNPRKFLKFDNLLTMISLIAAIVVVVLGEYFGRLKDADAKGPDWMLQVLSFLLLFTWIELMSLLGRLPALGYYAIMFMSVLKNVLKVLSIFICLLLGFALSFSIQFHHSPEFSNPWKALVKTTVMMAGEFEYTDLFKSHSWENEYSLIIARFLFLLFIVLNSIVLMNLMIALAASDIQTLQVESHARKMKKQAYFLYHMEKVLLCKLLTSDYIPRLLARFLKSRSKIKTRYQINRSMRHSRNLPNRLIEHIKRIGKENKKVVH